MRFKMNKLAAAVAATMGVSAVGIGTAQADEILFPYVVASETVTTLVSTINYGDPFVIIAGVEAPKQLHYRYYYKNGADAESNTAGCHEVDERFPSSANDIVTFDVAQHFATDNLGILFEDVATSTNANYGSRSFSLLNITLPVRAFLVVDNNDFFTGEGIYDTRDTIAGEAIVLEFVTGAAWGYSAYNAAGEYDNFRRTNLYDFSDRFETAGEVIADDGFVPVALAPFASMEGEFVTKFFVTPIATSGGQLQSNLNARIRLAVQDPKSSTLDVMFDRDELPVSGQVPQNVVCVGAVEASTMLTEGAQNRVPNGGWSNLQVLSGTVTGSNGAVTSGSTNEAIVFKLEYNPSDLKLDADSSTAPAVGTINNAIWLRKGIRESIQPDTSPRLQVYEVGGDINVNVTGIQ